MKTVWQFWKTNGAAFVLCLSLLCCLPSIGFGDDQYGAIAYSTRNGAWGWGNNFDTQEEAESRALAECKRHGSGCEVVQWFRNACGALASAGNRASGHAWNESREETADQAIAWCRRYGGRDCALRCAVCTGD